MEAVAAVSGSWTALCPDRCQASQCFSSQQRNLAFPTVKRFKSGTALRTSSDFEDQSHVQFYLDVRCSRKEKVNKRSPKAYGKDMAVFQNCAQGMEESKQVLKARKKMQKMDSSSSSSSSESGSSDCESRVMRFEEAKRTESGSIVMEQLKAEWQQPQETRKSRKFDVEQFKKEWEELSRSELLNSIPRFTPEFTIEPPLTITIEHLKKSYDLPTFRPPPQTVEDSVAVAEPSNTIFPCNSVISQSLMTLAAPVIDEDTSVDFSAAQFKLAVAHVDVCMGGKCKKAGAGEILAAFQSSSPGVTVSPCKCMKNCKAAVSVRIEDDDETSTYTRVSLEDVNVLLQKHCSTGMPFPNQSSSDKQLGADF